MITNDIALSEAEIKQLNSQAFIALKVLFKQAIPNHSFYLKIWDAFLQSLKCSAQDFSSDEVLCIQIDKGDLKEALQKANFTVAMKPTVLPVVVEVLSYFESKRDLLSWNGKALKLIQFLINNLWQSQLFNPQHQNIVQIIIEQLLRTQFFVNSHPVIAEKPVRESLQYVQSYLIFTRAIEADNCFVATIVLQNRMMRKALQDNFFQLNMQLAILNRDISIQTIYSSDIFLKDIITEYFKMTIENASIASFEAVCQLLQLLEKNWNLNKYLAQIDRSHKSRLSLEIVNLASKPAAQREKYRRSAFLYALYQKYPRFFLEINAEVMPLIKQIYQQEKNVGSVKQSDDYLIRWHLGHMLKELHEVGEALNQLLACSPLLKKHTLPPHILTRICTFLPAAEHLPSYFLNQKQQKPITQPPPPHIAKRLKVV